MSTSMPSKLGRSTTSEPTTLSSMQSLRRMLEQYEVCHGNMSSKSMTLSFHCPKTGARYLMFLMYNEYGIVISYSTNMIASSIKSLSSYSNLLLSVVVGLVCAFLGSQVA